MNLGITCMLSEHRALLRKLLLPLLCALSGCATVQDGEAADALEYACGDLAVVGRIVTISSKASPGSDGLPNWRSQSNLRSEEHTSELQSLMRISYAVFCLKKQTKPKNKKKYRH